jgi:hypothetical protein
MVIKQSIDSSKGWLLSRVTAADVALSQMFAEGRGQINPSS